MKKNIYLVVLFLFLISSLTAQEKEMSLSMQEAIDYAIKNSYQNKTAVNNILSAEKKKWETTTIGLPQINGAVDYQNWLEQQVSLLPAEITGGAAGTFTPVVFSTKQNMGASVTLTQLLFDGSYLVGLQSAKTYLKISEQAKEKTELATREAVINAYGNVLVAEKTIDILLRNKKVSDSLLREARAAYENGLAEQEDVERFEISEGTIEANIRNAKRLKEIAYQYLNYAIGNNINTKLTLTETLDALVLSNTDLGLLAKNFDLNSHIDYKIAENSRESSRLLMKLEQSKALPSLNAFINYGVNAYSETFSFLNGDQKWFDQSMFGVSLNVPIFSSFSRSSKTDQAKIALENADIELEEAKQKLNLQAQQARSNYQLSIENYETAKKNLGLAERIENKQQIKFKEGVTTSFELLQAQQDLYLQQNNYVQSMLNIIANKANLENALNIPVNN